MSKFRNPFRLNVGFIAHQEVGYKHEFTFEFEQIQITDDLDLRNFAGLVKFSRTPQGLLTEGKFDTQTTLQCVRCLNDFEQDLQYHFTELYAFNKKSMTDSELLLPDDAHIDLQPLIREYALLEFPMRPLCKPDCKGLCMVCGVDLNKTDCGHKQTSEESPFSVLKDLLGD
ncbi:MAG: DUF177 domain-containing protein [Anaerolineales bacterium]